MASKNKAVRVFRIDFYTTDKVGKHLVRVDSKYGGVAQMRLLVDTISLMLQDIDNALQSEESEKEEDTKQS